MATGMETSNDVISRNIIRDMGNGVLVIDKANRIISFVNDSAAKILDKPKEEMVGKKFAMCFFEYEENNAFNDCVVSAINESDVSHKVTIPYFTGKETKTLYVTSSYTKDDDGNPVGVVLILDDITEKAKLEERLMKNQVGTIMMMAELVESRDGNTGGHIRRTAEYVKIIAQQLYEDKKFPKEIDSKFLNDIVTAAPLHDVGKISVSDTILNKPGKLTDEEFAIMKSHAAVGRNLLKDAVEATEHSSFLDTAIDMAGAHHEWWNGRGYPDGISGESIPLSARIMAIADVFDALVSKRVYKPGMPLEKAYAIIREETGTHFDPVCVDAFFKAQDKIESAMNLLNDDATQSALRG